MTENEPKKSGWEIADKAAHGVGKTFDGVALVIMKVYGLGLVVLGIILLVTVFAQGWWVGLLFIAYGLYLLFPGSKFVIW